MQVSIGAKCWDGYRRKSLTDVIKVEGLPVNTAEHRQPRKWNARKLRMIAGYTIPVVFLASGLPPYGLTGALAQTVAPDAAAVPALSSEVRSKILHAFDPLIDLAVLMSYPIAGVMISAGCLFIMVGNREKGMQMLQNAALGYILVQLSPMLLELLVGVGSTI